MYMDSDLLCRWRHTTSFSSLLSISWSLTMPTISSSGFPCSCPPIFEPKWFACGAERYSWVVCTATWMPVRRMGAIVVPLDSNVIQPLVGGVFCELLWCSTSTVSTEQRKEWALFSYTSEDKKLDRERYIHVAAIDIAIVQGTWSIYYILWNG